MQDNNAIATLSLIQVSRCHQDANTLLRNHLVYDPPELTSRDRIDPDGRLIKQQHGRIAKQFGRT